MKLKEAIETLKANTMACWWPCKTMGRQSTDFHGIIHEVLGLLEGIRIRQGIPGDATFYSLDDKNNETDLHDQLVAALMVIRNSQFVRQDQTKEEK